MKKKYLTQAFSLSLAQHATGQTLDTLTQFFVLLLVFLFWLSSLISSKSVASISGNLAKDSIWVVKKVDRKVGKFGHYQHKTKPCERWSLADVWAVIIAAIWLANVRFINLTFDWLMESIQIFLKLDGFLKPKGIVPAKAFLFILNLDTWQKLINNRSVGNIGFWCSYIIIVVIDASCVIHCSC